MEARFRQFQSGDWTSLLMETAAVLEDAHSRSVKRRRWDTKNDEAKGSRGQWLGYILGNCRQRGRLWRELQWPGVATLAGLTNPERRPRVPRQRLMKIMRMVPGEQCQLDRDEFLIGLRKARREAAAGPSGMTSVNLFLLESEADSDLLVGWTLLWLGMCQSQF